MCPLLWVTWPELAISEGTYIWAVCSPKRESHVIKMNIWLYRHWHLFENEKNSSCFHQITVLLISWFLASWFIARFHRFVILFLMLSILFVVPSIWGTSAAFLLCLDRWTWRRKEGKLKRRKTGYKRKKVVANLTRLTCMEWPFEMTVCWNVEMVICWDVDWLLSLRWFFYDFCWSCMC